MSIGKSKVSLGKILGLFKNRLVVTIRTSWVLVSLLFIFSMDKIENKTLKLTYFYFLYCLIGKSYENRLFAKKKQLRTNFVKKYFFIADNRFCAVNNKRYNKSDTQ